MWVLGMKPQSPEEQSVPLTTEPSFQPFCFCVCMCVCVRVGKWVNRGQGCEWKFWKENMLRQNAGFHAGVSGYRPTRCSVSFNSSPPVST